MLRSLSDVQEDFAAALLDPAAVEPRDVADPEGNPTPRRFRIYRNNVAVGLVNAVSGVYPAIKRIVGDQFFDAMALAYVRVEPPTSPVLLEYGQGFADFIACFEPAASLPYLADVARIEWAWREAYHAAEADRLGPGDLAGIPETDLPSLTFSLHPSVHVIRSAFPVLTIWRMNTGEEPIVPVDLRVCEDALIVRPETTVEVRQLPAGGALFLEVLASGGSLAQAATRVTEAEESFDLSANIAGLIDSGAVVGYAIGR